MIDHNYFKRVLLVGDGNFELAELLKHVSDTGKYNIYKWIEKRGYAFGKIKASEEIEGHSYNFKLLIEAIPDGVIINGKYKFNPLTEDRLKLPAAGAVISLKANNISLVGLHKRLIEIYNATEWENVAVVVNIDTPKGVPYDSTLFDKLRMFSLETDRALDNSLENTVFYVSLDKNKLSKDEIDTINFYDPEGLEDAFDRNPYVRWIDYANPKAPFKAIISKMAYDHYFREIKVL